jgi:hypothetical protein
MYQLLNSNDNRGFISNSLDSIIKQIINKDTLPNTVAFFYIDFMGRGGKGCVINKRNKIYEGRIFELGTVTSTERIMQPSEINKVNDMLDGLFRQPKDYVENFFPNKKEYLSHDNTLFLFIKKESITIFNEKLMRSSILGTSNKKSIQLVRDLGSLL